MGYNEFMFEICIDRNKRVTWKVPPQSSLTLANQLQPKPE